MSFEKKKGRKICLPWSCSDLLFGIVFSSIHIRNPGLFVPPDWARYHSNLLQDFRCQTQERWSFLYRSNPVFCSVQSEEAPMSVLHIQYPEWPDHGVPKDTLVVREVFKRLNQVPPSAGPIVVHCRFISGLSLCCFVISNLNDITYLSHRHIFHAQCRNRENWNILCDS